MSRTLLHNWECSIEKNKNNTEELLKIAEDIYNTAYARGKASEERPQGKWIDYSNEGYVECPFCGSATNCEDNKDELHYCFNCGAEMRSSNKETAFNDYLKEQLKDPEFRKEWVNLKKEEG